MHNKKVLSFALLGILLLFFTISGNAQAQLKVGDEAPSFTLPSTEDRLVDYYKDYYGKYHLVMTFFPAAFTPI